MHKLPTIKGREFIKFLQSLGFKIVRTKGSHVRLRTEEQKKVTTIPIHKNKDIPIFKLTLILLSLTNNLQNNYHALLPV